MSYRSISGTSFANKALMVAQIYSELEAAGWTLVDNQDGSNYRVYSSNGESEKLMQQYIQIDKGTSSAIKFTPYGWWNSSTHTGTCRGWSTNVLQVPCYESSTNNLWMLISKDICCMGIQYGSSYYASFFGHITNRIWSAVGTTTASAGAGSIAVLNLTDISGQFIPGQVYQLMGCSGEGRYQVTVSGTGANSVTVTPVPVNFASGAIIGTRPVLFGCFPCNGGASYGLLTANFHDSGTAGSTDVLATYPIVNINENSYGLSNLGADYAASGALAAPIMFSVANAQNSENKGVFGYSDDRVLYAWPNSFSNADTLELGHYDSGTVSGSVSSSAMQDVSKSWGTNALSGMTVVITLGTGVGQTRRIASNTSDTITLTQDFATPPVSGNSTYSIASKVYRTFQMGWNSGFWLTFQDATN